MNDYKITLTKKQQIYLSKMLPKGYSFQLYKVRKNILDYPTRQFDKKYKKTQSIILTKKESIMQSKQHSEQSYRQRSQTQTKYQNYSTLQIQCLTILRKLRKHQSSYPFRSPVDPKALQIPDYFDIVIEPIDLKTIQQIIKKGQYQHISQFQRDIYKMIMNSYKYNQETSATYTKTIQFQQMYVLTMRDFYTNRYQPPPQNKQNNIKQEQEQLKYVPDQQIKDPKEGNLKQNSNQLNIANTNQAKQKLKTGGKLTSQITPQQTQNFQKIKVSKKTIPKHLIAKIEQNRDQVKIQQPQDSYFPALPVSQPVDAPIQQKMDSQQFIKQQFKSMLQNQTQNNRDQVFSEGYNEYSLGSRIPNVQVQKQISHLLKRLNEYPLTKQKRNKIASKFNNLQANMTQTDKKKLYEKIFRLQENDIEYVVNIIGKNSLLKQNQVQIDLDKVDNKALRQIQNLISLRQAENNPNNYQNHEYLQHSNYIPLNDTKNQTKKAKKDDKKILKKKLSRKNSNDDSFSLNVPVNKKKKTQKGQKVKENKKVKTQNQNNQNNSNQQKSESSYNPQKQYQNSHAHNKVNQTCNLDRYNAQRTANNNNIGYNQIQSLNSNGRLQNIQNLVFLYTQAPSIQTFRHLNNPYIQPQANMVNYQEPHVYDTYKFDDIEQYLVPSKHPNNENESYAYNHHNQQSVPLSARSGGKGRNINEYQLDSIQDHQFHLGQSAQKVGFIGDDQIREYSMQDQKEQNDQDQFF